MIERVLCNWKPPRGSTVLAREEERERAVALERKVKATVKKRDGRCRWPEQHKCRGGMECAHVRDASLGGAMEPFNLIYVCAWIHRRGPESIHGKQLRVERETAQDVAHPLFSFWKQDAAGEYYLIAREIAPFEFEKD